MAVNVVVLAGGLGTRLRSDSPKAVASLAGRALILRALDSVRTLKPQRVVVVVAASDSETPAVVREEFPEVGFAVQKKARGTGDAAAAGVAEVSGAGATVVMFVDAPLVTGGTLRKLVGDSARRWSGGIMRPAAGAAGRVKGGVSLLVFHADNPKGYGRVVRNSDGEVCGIVEEREATPAVRKIREVFAGPLCAPADWLRTALAKVRPVRRGGEVYLTGLPALAVADGIPVATVSCDETEAMGVNSSVELSRAESVWRSREVARLQARGVVFADPLRADIRGTVRGGRGAFVDINAVFVGDVKLGAGCVVGANCVLENSSVGPRAVVHPFSHLCGAVVGGGCEVGPFARLRPGAKLGEGAKVGNFVEVKNAALGAGVKAGHLAYLGDATVGAGANIGAGVITCNYDGAKKSRTIVGEGAFVGSGSQLVAPVSVGARSYVAAGSAITRDVSEDALAFARARQSERKNGAKARQRKNVRNHRSD